MNSAEAFEGADDIRRAWLAGLAPDPSLTVSQWADRHRVLSSRSASEAGPYRTSDIADAMQVAITALGPVRANLIKKGMVYSPSHGDMAFTVPLFDEFLRRAMPR